MKLNFDKKFWIKVGCWLIVLALIPVAAELIFLADIVGVEAALTFFLLYVKDIRDRVVMYIEATVYTYRYIVKNCIQHSFFGFYPGVAHSMASFLLLVISGSIFIATSVWFSYVIMGSRLLI